MIHHQRSHMYRLIGVDRGILYVSEDIDDQVMYPLMYPLIREMFPVRNSVMNSIAHDYATATI